MPGLVPLWRRLQTAFAGHAFPETAGPAATQPFDIFVFPVIDYEYRFQRPQHFSRELARRGRRVFYFSTKFQHADCDALIEPRQVENGVYLVTLPAGAEPPDIYRDIPSDWQLHAMERGVFKLKEQLGIGATVSLVDYPFWYPLAARLSNNVTVYDCMDDYAGFRNAGLPVERLEPLLIRHADLVVCSAANLREKVRRHGRESVLIRNAVDPSHFAPRAGEAAPTGGGRRTVGYHGAINSWTDVDLLAYAARQLPALRFVVVGAVEGVDVTALAACPNVTMVGEVPYQRLPEYVAAFDAGVVPYRICGYSLASDPVKIWEYLAAGKPVVSVRYPELEPLGDLVRLVDTKEEFAAAIADELESDTPERRAGRLAFARRNTWAERAGRLEAEAARLFPKVSVVVLCHNQLPFTRSALNGLDGFTQYPNLELILVDNSSSDGTPAFLERWAAKRPWTRVLRLADNRGFAAGNNEGARISSGDYLVFLNNDVFVTEGWVGGLLAHFRGNPKLGLLGPVTNRSGNESVIEIAYENMEEMAQRARCYTRARRGRRTPLRVAHLFCAMLPRHVWERVGELDEAFGLGYFEDDDYSMRVRQAGFEVACAEDVFVHHHHSASFDALEGSVRDALFQRNKLYFESKWGRWEAPVFRAGAGG